MGYSSADLGKPPPQKKVFRQNGGWGFNPYLPTKTRILYVLVRQCNGVYPSGQLWGRWRSMSRCLCLSQASRQERLNQHCMCQGHRQEGRARAATCATSRKEKKKSGATAAWARQVEAAVLKVKEGGAGVAPLPPLHYVSQASTVSGSAGRRAS